MKILPLRIKKQFDSEEIAAKVLDVSYTYVAKSGIVIALIIAFFELLMLVETIFWGSSDAVKNYRYCTCYIFLFVCSIALAICISIWRKDVKKHGTAFYYAQLIYIIAITAWAVRITLLDGYYHDYFDVVVYMTIMLIVPIMTYLNPYVLFLTHFIGDVIIFAAIVELGYHGTMINFAVYSVISICACMAYQHTKKKMFIQQVSLMEKATRDPLTGINNRQNLIENGNNIVAECIKEGHSVAVIMADIDLFKSINDKYGHLAGDRIIKKVAKAFECACDDDKMSCYRYGGEEFLMLMPHTDKETAIAKTEEIRNLIQKLTADDKDGIKVTASFGVYAAVPSEEEKLRVFLSRADKLLYESKEKGRNCYTVNE